MERITRFFREEAVLSCLLIAFILLTVFVPGHILEYHTYIDYRTMVTLLALIIAATGIKRSGYLDAAARHMLKGIRDERMLAAFMSAMSVVLSMFLTNDIALFIVVPLTVSMQKVLKNDLTKIVIFEAIAVNAGSTLTPIGNPQNLFVWNGWGISFLKFTAEMSMPFIVMFCGLGALILAAVRPHGLKLNSEKEREPVVKKLGIISFALMAAFILSLQFGAGVYMLPVILFVYLFLYPAVLKEIDWLLLLTFVFMFIDFSLLAKAPALQSLFSRLDLSGPGRAYMTTALLSQVISNVPASIFVSKFSGNWKAIAYGADVAGNGIIIGSLANIIAIRLLKPAGKTVLLEFHAYSIPFFIVKTAV